MNIIAYPAQGYFPANGTVLAGGNAPAEVETLPISAIGHSRITAHGSHVANGPEGINRRGVCYKQGLAGIPTIEDNAVWEDGLFFDEEYSLEITGLMADTPYRLAAVVEKYGNYFYAEPLVVSPRTTYMRAAAVCRCPACRVMFMEDPGIQDSDTCPNCGAGQEPKNKEEKE